MQMKQTAVEWLVEQLKDYDFADIKDDEYYIIKIPTWILKEKEIQAKEMEKEQIIKAHGIKESWGWKDGWNWWKEKTGEQYYNETFKSE